METIPRINRDEDPAAFPEEDYPPHPERRVLYAARVAHGRARMRASRSVLFGLARNLESILPATLARIERLGRMFDDYRALVYENDSTDATPSLLRDWEARNPHATAVLERRGDPVNSSTACLKRVTRMAYYRNQCLSRVRAQWADFDYVIVVDMDLDGGWSYDGVANTFGHPDWDFVGAYGVQKKIFLTRTELLQYDAWAFRRQGSDTRVPTRDANRMSWRRGDDLVAVNSCFGGLGVYRMQAILSADYDGSDIEHVALHRKMRQAGYDRFFLNPSQITFYGVKYSRLVRHLRRMMPSLLRPAA